MVSGAFLFGEPHQGLFVENGGPPLTHTLI
jgi:hypothetical protein